MTQGRKPNPPYLLEPQVEINHEIVAVDSLDAAENGRRLAPIDATYGDGTPYTREGAIHKARFCLKHASDAMLEAGKQLLLIKEHELHGDFIDALLKIGLHERTARRMMSATLKFANPNTTALSYLGQTKLLELMVEDDQELENLAEGGTIAGLNLDKIQRMTTRELQAALRKERQARKDDAEVSDRLIADKNKRLDQLARFKTLPEQINQARLDSVAHTGEALNVLDKFAQLHAHILNVDLGAHDNEAIISTMVVPYVHSLWQIQARLAQLLDDAETSLSGYMPDHLVAPPGSPPITGEDIVRILDTGFQNGQQIMREHGLLIDLPPRQPAQGKKPRSAGSES